MPLPLPQDVAESSSFARTMAQAPRLGARAAVSVAGVEVSGLPVTTRAGPSGWGWGLDYAKS